MACRASRFCGIATVLLLVGPIVGAAERKAPALDPSAEETAVLLRLNHHRGDWRDGDYRIDEVIRAKEISASGRHWELACSHGSAKRHSPPLVCNPQLMAAARALLKQRAEQGNRKRFDAADALTAAGYVPAQPNLVLIAHDVASLPTAYAAALTNEIGEAPDHKTTRPLYAAQQAQKPEWRECGIAVTGQPPKLSLVIVLGAGSAKRHLGGVAYADADHDGRYAPGEGKAGVVVTCGAASVTTGGGGAWWLALDHADAVEVTMAVDGWTQTRSATAASTAESFAWRIPDKEDVRNADRLIAEAEKAAAGKDEERARAAAAALLTGTRLAVLDEARERKIASLVEPIREDFDRALQEVLSALGEDPAEARKLIGALKKRWKNAMPAWFKEAEALVPLRAQVIGMLSTPAEQHGKLRPVVLKLLVKSRETSADPTFLDQYLVWLAQVDRVQGEALGEKCLR